MKYVIDGILSFYINNPYTLIKTIILIILCVLIKLYYPKFRGFMGEFWVKQELKKLPKKGYIVLNDIMLSDNKGSHQIDHLVISKFGIFVIEMKNYYGLIKGKEFDNKWCQYLGKTKNYFINPFHQNYGHIKSLLNFIDLDEDKFVSVICFSNQANVDVKSKNVVYVDNLIDYIISYNKPIIDDNLDDIKQIILSNNISEKDIRKNHVKNIKNKINFNRKFEENMICPKCKNKLINKNGKYGEFIGCSNFPKCKYTIKK